MKIAMIGTGYVGLVSGTCFSEFGTHVACVDKDAKKIERLQRGEIPIFEPGLDELVKRNVASGRLSFTTSLKEALKDAEAVFIAVGTPSRRGDGHADLTYVFAAVDEIADLLDHPAVIVTKSTVPVGTGQEIARRLKERRPGIHCDVASNPEFLREGSAIEDFMHPDRVVVGVNSERAQEVLARLYRPLSQNGVPVLFTEVPTAELIKYAANAFLATKITFINEMADICEKVGANIRDVSKGIGMDKRIGTRFLLPGPGYGGSCFPKDTLALLRLSEEAGAPTRIVGAVVEVNEARKKKMTEKIIAACGGSVANKKIAVLGLTFKPNTDDMRDSPSLVIVPGLLEAGATVHAYDPEGMKEAKAHFKDSIVYGTDPYEVMESAHALVLLTEWNQFRNLDLARVKKLLKEPTVVDMRNVYKRSEMRKAGMDYSSIGRVKLV
ncbi:MAG: UDP-glucose/GDP-mannose dehydrogenase family protein [Alphaproteobacteria bacterium]|nr:UDP-glucose/GDP-mannose dehydrogenase family protein [Alphaproteobacteria bacterium]